MVRGISLVYGLYLLLPMALLVVGSFGQSWTNTLLPSGLTGHWYADLWADPSFRKAFVSSLTVALAACAIDAVLALPLAYALYAAHLRHDPAAPDWVDRDRFVLSVGHASMLLYGTLHLSGYPLPLDELRNFRQWESLTPGHPEVHHTKGVETTTGPLGQGVANAVGFAVAGPSREDDPPTPYELYAIYTRAAWWGSGLGQTLWDAVRPDGPCSLWVLEANARAQGFYRRNGFAPDGARELYAGLDGWEIRMVRA